MSSAGAFRPVARGTWRGRGRGIRGLQIQCWRVPVPEDQSILHRRQRRRRHKRAFGARAEDHAIQLLRDRSTALRIRKLNLEPFSSRARTSGAGPGAISATTFSCSAPAAIEMSAPVRCCTANKTSDSVALFALIPSSPLRKVTSSSGWSDVHHANRFDAPRSVVGNDQAGTLRRRGRRIARSAPKRRAAAPAHDLDDDGAARRKYLIRLRGFQIEYQARDRRLRLKQAERAGLSLRRDPPTGCAVGRWERALGKSITSRSGPVNTCVCGTIRSLASTSISTASLLPSTFTLRIDDCGTRVCAEQRLTAATAAHKVRPATADSQKFGRTLCMKCLRLGGLLAGSTELVLARL